MLRALIGKKTLNDFREFLVGWTLRKIDDEFSAANIIRSTPVLAVSGERRSRVEEYYASLNLTDPSDIRRLLDVFEIFLVQSYQSGNERVDDLVRWLRKKRQRVREPTASRTWGRRRAASSRENRSDRRATTSRRHSADRGRG